MANVLNVPFSDLEIKRLSVSEIVAWLLLG